MVEAIEKMLANLLADLERGKLNRRQFAVSVASLVAAACAAPAAASGPLTAALRPLAAAPDSFRAISLNHVTVRVPDLQRTSRFYQEFFGMPLRQQAPKVHILGVGQSFFGIEQGDDQVAAVNHFDFGIESFNADKIRARLSELNLKFFDTTSQESFKFYDPDGFQVQVNGPDYVGHVS